MIFNKLIRRDPMWIPVIVGVVLIVVVVFDMLHGHLFITPFWPESLRLK